jgi:redox-sensitive bicupin YhaK (pirin superfamily)
MMAGSAILSIRELGFPWQPEDPFLFCVHHLDDFPAGNAELGPAASLAGRDIGQDFDPRQEWRMYHGETVPGFPAHPHRGFETVTVVIKGLIDHTDSHGSAGRYGNGDVQWLTAGAGIQHAEMFPLLDADGGNPLELFQIWLNLPAANKFAQPYYTMLWAEDIPRLTHRDAAGNEVEVNVVAGSLGGLQVPSPPPDSWAADPANGLAIWTIRMAAHASWSLPSAPKDVNRALFFYRGARMTVEGADVPARHSVRLHPGKEAVLEAGPEECRLLLLQGRPMNEPVAQRGPFVMNTQEEIAAAYRDYRKDQFGGWPWPRHDPVHPRQKGRFARFTDGKEVTR